MSVSVQHVTLFKESRDTWRLSSSINRTGSGVLGTGVDSGRVPSEASIPCVAAAESVMSTRGMGVTEAISRKPSVEHIILIILRMGSKSDRHSYNS
ncbi:hypothetical protein [Paenibacillus glucanolyticus]|uniref:hypothetical protein n=1 Tax=Paenibacillus glucanolyticus TaxID=59843 RepID=UPI00188376E6|nr:hypothetical protein [Paenibacillus glucanolyticus]